MGMWGPVHNLLEATSVLLRFVGKGCLLVYAEFQLGTP